jgi:hypothetical protein
MATGFVSVFAKADPDPGEPNQYGSGTETLTTDYCNSALLFLRIVVVF